MGTQLPLPQRGTPPIFGPYLLRPNGSMDQDVTWYGARPRPRRFCVRWGPRSPSPKGGGAPKFSAHVYCFLLYSCEKAICLRPDSLFVTWGLTPQKGGTAPNIRPISTVAKRSPISATAELLFGVSRGYQREQLLFISRPTFTVLSLPLCLEYNITGRFHSGTTVIDDCHKHVCIFVLAR